MGFIYEGIVIDQAKEKIQGAFNRQKKITTTFSFN